MPQFYTKLHSTLESHQRLVTVIEFARAGKFLEQSYYYRGPGRPFKDRTALVHAYIAKAVYNLSDTTDLIDRLKCDKVIRRPCGSQGLSDIPNESTFSRAFSEFSQLNLANRIHQAFLETHFSEHMVSHISRDSTAIEAREKAVIKRKTKISPSH